MPVCCSQRIVAIGDIVAIVAILAGSRVRGVASSASDYDVMVFFESLPNGALRKLMLKGNTSNCLRMTCAQAEGTGGADSPF